MAVFLLVASPHRLNVHLGIPRFQTLYQSGLTTIHHVSVSSLSPVLFSHLLLCVVKVTQP